MISICGSVFLCSKQIPLWCRWISWSFLVFTIVFSCITATTPNIVSSIVPVGFACPCIRVCICRMADRTFDMSLILKHLFQCRSPGLKFVINSSLWWARRCRLAWAKRSHWAEQYFLCLWSTQICLSQVAQWISWFSTGSEGFLFGKVRICEYSFIFLLVSHSVLTWIALAWCLISLLVGYWLVKPFLL